MSNDIGYVHNYDIDDSTYVIEKPSSIIQKNIPHKFGIKEKFKFKK